MVQAQVFVFPGLGRQRCGQPPLLELQALVVPAESEVGKQKRAAKVSITGSCESLLLYYNWTIEPYLNKGKGLNFLPKRNISDYFLQQISKFNGM